MAINLGHPEVNKRIKQIKEVGSVVGGLVSVYLLVKLITTRGKHPL